MGQDDRRHTLLIVDDEPGLLQSLRNQFLRDYRVLTSEDGHSALEILGREDIHVILSDQRMPGMTGDVFLSQARVSRPDAVRMLFTGYADIQAVINAVNEGRIFRYILKPWDPLELEGIVRQAVEHHDLISDRRRLIAELREANLRLSRADRELLEANEQKRALIETGRLRSDLEVLTRRVKMLEDVVSGSSSGPIGSIG
ncbi:response regulator [Tundrisphaera lichenicola]|uniref:response regulator n=1 Tax=Tundrisphaera lichenicola TaxID=2029860 RepID=UPI003EBF2916